jgi:hypothetical protein
MVYAPERTELSFLRVQHPPSPKEVLSRWKACFSEDCHVIDYNAIAARLVPAFYASVFDIPVEENQRENYSLDMLTLQVYNTFIKGLRGAGVERVVWEFINEFPVSDVFPEEAELVDELAARFPTEGWNLPELGSAERLLDDWSPREAPEDPIRTCDRMLALFGGLRAHLASQRASQPERGD